MSPFEITGFVFGIAGVWLTIKESAWCFPVGLVSVIVSLILFFQQKLYSEVIQQVVYIILLSYGWYKWIAGKDYEKDLEISFSPKKLLFVLLLLSVFYSIASGTILKKYTDASVPYWDASATALSFIAQWMIAKKKIENWIIWIVVNLLYIGIYIYKDLFLYSILFFIYLVLAIQGWFQWKKVYENKNPELSHVS